MSEISNIHFIFSDNILNNNLYLTLTLFFMGSVRYHCIKHVKIILRKNIGYWCLYLYFYLLWIIILSVDMVKHKYYNYNKYILLIWL